MRIMKEADENKKDAPFIGYAKNNGLDNEEKASSLLKIARMKAAKEAGKEQDEFGPEEMAILWKIYKDMVKNKKEESIIKEAVNEQMIKVGDALTNNEGAIFNVLNIWIDNFHLKPEAWLEIEWTLNNKRGKQKLSVSSFRKQYFS